MKKIIPLLALVLLCLGLQPAFSANADIQEISQSTLANMINKNSGKVILLNFFATWCPPCKTEIPELVRLRNVFPPEKLEIIGISVDEDTAPLPGFLKETGADYPVFIASKEITDNYQINSVPHMVMYNPTGQMVLSETGLAEFDLLQSIVEELLAKAGTGK